jgi:hypothetical protein
MKKFYRVESDESQEDIWSEDAAQAAHEFWYLHEDEDIVLIRKQ